MNEETDTEDELKVEVKGRSLDVGARSVNYDLLCASY